MLVTDHDVASEISRLVLLELEAASDRNEFGVIVRDVRPYSPARLAALLRTSRVVKSGRLRAALIGCEPREVHGSDLLTTQEDVAVAWRNERLKTIAVLSDRPLAKAASLKQFRYIGEAELIARLCKEQEALADVRWLKALWSALSNNKVLRLPLRFVVRFALMLASLPKSARSTDAARHLASLGLFPDLHLPEQQSDRLIVQRLRTNRDQRDLVRRAGEGDWARIQFYLKSLPAKERPPARAVQKALRDISGATPEQQAEILYNLDLELVRRVWIGRPERQLDSKVKRTARVEVERVIGELLLRGDQERLGDVASELTQVVQHALDGDDATGEQPLRGASAGDSEAVVEVDCRLLALVRSRSTQTDWGGVITIASERQDALLEQVAFENWKPFRIDDAITQASAFTRAQAAPPLFPELLAQLSKAREALLPVAPELAASPIVVLAGRPDLLVAAEAYIEKYDEVLQLLASTYGGMQVASAHRAEELLSVILSLELYVYRRDVVTEVVLSPLHPLHLWRAATIVSETREISQLLSTAEAEAMQAALAEDVQFLPALLVPALVAGGDKPQLFGQAGLLGRLQIFRATPRGMSEPDGVKTVADLNTVAWVVDQTKRAT